VRLVTWDVDQETRARRACWPATVPGVEAHPRGPLSYDVTVPDKDPSAQRGIIWALLTVVAGWILAVVGGWFVLGSLARPQIVHRGFPLGLIVLVVAASLWGTRNATNRAKRNAVLAALALSFVGSFTAYNTLANVKPTLPQIRRELDRVTPGGFRLASEDTHGDRLCRRGCPTVKRVYEPPSGDPDPVKTFVLALFDDGWQQTDDQPPELATSASHGSVIVHLTERADGTVEVTATRH
jgi:hypothetical protein